MDYKLIKWQDHIVERPGTFKEIQNGDGTVTHVSAEGGTLQQGTPVNARNLNKMDEGIYNANLIAGENRELITSLAVEVSILKQAALNNFSHNIFVEDFEDITDLKVTHGVYESANKRMVI